MYNALDRLRRLAVAARSHQAGSRRYSPWPDQPSQASRAGYGFPGEPPRLIDVRLGSLDLALRREGWFAMARDRE